MTGNPEVDAYAMYAQFMSAAIAGIATRGSFHPHDVVREAAAVADVAILHVMKRIQKKEDK